LAGARAEDLARCAGQAPERCAHGGMMYEGDDGRPATRNRSVTDGKVRVRMTPWRGTATTSAPIPEITSPRLPYSAAQAAAACATTA
jgi:hypothetical protein